MGVARAGHKKLHDRDTITDASIVSTGAALEVEEVAVRAILHGYINVH